MKSICLKLAAAAGLAGLLAGCTTPDGGPNYTGSGALIGGASGAAIGALADRRAPGAGALIGGAAGLIAGGLIGHGMDEDACWRASVSPPPYIPPPLAPAPVPPTSLEEIKSMSRSGLTDDVIIGQINNTRAVYHLDANAIIELHNAGVSQKVITYMLGTANQVVLAQAPPPPQPEPVVAAPGPDYVWTDGEWVWSGGTWVWVGGRWMFPPRPHAIWIHARWEHGPRGWYHVGGRWR